MVGPVEQVGTRRFRHETLAAVPSLVAALVHGVVTPAHFEEWWAYGMFFIFVGAAQALFAIALLTNAINPKDSGPNWLRIKRGVLWLGIALNVGAILMWLLSRTFGIPLGPEAGTVEPVGVLDLLAKAAEALTVVFVVLALQAPGNRAPAPGA